MNYFMTMEILYIIIKDIPVRDNQNDNNILSFVKIIVTIICPLIEYTIISIISNDFSKLNECYNEYHMHNLHVSTRFRMNY